MEDIKKGRKLFLIQGDAGTGKTLLTYHLAKELIRNFEKRRGWNN